MPTWKVTPDVERFDAAVDWFLKRTVITGKQARTLDDATKTDAFWVGNGLQLAQVQRVFDALAKAIEKGTTLEDFKKQMKSTLKDPGHAETVFRNATQRAYNAGRWFQMTEPSVARFRPYGLFDAILDGRTTKICESCNKVLLPLDDAWWLTHLPPLHHRCRSSVRNLRRAEAEKREQKKPPSDADPQPGWGKAPSKDGGWKPDPKKHDPALIKTLRKKKAANDNAPRKRKAKPKEEHDPNFWERKYAATYKGAASRSLGHGRAALERGLDMTPKQALKHLKQWHAASYEELVEQLQSLDQKRSIREQGGELDSLAKAAAGVAGHLSMLPKRSNIDVKGADPGAVKFFEQATGPKVVHPEKYEFVKLSGRASCDIFGKKLFFNDVLGTIEHEWSHALEAENPELERRAANFYATRTNGVPLKKLNELMPRGGYRDDEVARDAFYYPYIGKEYKHRESGKLFATELTSMGVELLSAGKTGWGTLSRWVKKDPEHFMFVLGQLRGE